MASGERGNEIVKHLDYSARSVDSYLGGVEPKRVNARVQKLSNGLEANKGYEETHLILPLFPLFKIDSQRLSFLIFDCSVVQDQLSFIFPGLVFLLSL